MPVTQGDAMASDKHISSSIGPLSPLSFHSVFAVHFRSQHSHTSTASHDSITARTTQSIDDNDSLFAIPFNPSSRPHRHSPRERLSRPRRTPHECSSLRSGRTGRLQGSSPPTTKFYLDDVRKLAWPAAHGTVREEGKTSWPWWTSCSS